MSIDPLAQKYTYNSPYAFQENKMGMGRELEGLELVEFGWLPPETMLGTSETITTEAGTPEMSFALDEVTVSAAPKPSIGFFERIGNWFSRTWDSITGSGKTSESNASPENNTTPENTMEESIEQTKPDAPKENEPNIPNDWETKSSKKGGGEVSQDPNNPHNSVRKMPGNPESPNPAQQKPYYKYVKDGVSYDKNGNPLPSGKEPEAHIPQEEFNPKVMPEFK